MYLWAKNDTEKQQLLEDWFDEAVTKCAQNMGQDLASTSANGVSVSFMSSSMTIEQWLMALSGAIEAIKNPTTLRRKAVQVFR